MFGQTERKVVFTDLHQNNLTGDVDIEVVPEEDFKITEPKFNNPSMYCVVDPGKTEDSCNPSTNYQGKVIIITQPNEKNWGMSEFRKKRDSVKGLFLFLPVWTLQELLNAKQYFDKKNRIDDETIISRYEAVGGVPPHIFTEE